MAGYDGATYLVDPAGDAHICTPAHRPLPRCPTLSCSCTRYVWSAEGQIHVAFVGEDNRAHDMEDGMEISPREARKSFMQFLRTETRALGSEEPYSAQLMRQQGAHRKIDVDLQDIKSFDALLGQQLEERPTQYLPLVRAPVRNRAQDCFSRSSPDVALGESRAPCKQQAGSRPSTRGSVSQRDQQQG